MTRNMSCNTRAANIKPPCLLFTESTMFHHDSHHQQIETFKMKVKDKEIIYILTSVMISVRDQRFVANNLSPRLRVVFCMTFN